MVPLWATILVGLGGAALGLLGTLVTQWVARRNSKDTTAVAEKAVELDKSKSNRDLIRYAIDLRDGSPERLELSYDILEGIAAMPGLSADDVALVQSVTRPVTEPALDQGRMVERATGEQPEFVVEQDQPEEDVS